MPARDVNIATVRGEREIRSNVNIQHRVSVHIHPAGLHRDEPTTGIVGIAKRAPALVCGAETTVVVQFSTDIHVAIGEDTAARTGGKFRSRLKIDVGLRDLHFH